MIINLYNGTITWFLWVPFAGLIHTILLELFQTKFEVLSKNKDLVFLLHPSASHSVDDGVPARVHVHDGVDNGDERECKHNSEPKDDVEDGGVVSRVAVIIFTLKYELIWLLIFLN